MKKIFLSLVVIGSILISCQKDNEDIKPVQKSLEEIETDDIETNIYRSFRLRYYLVGGPSEGMPPGMGFCDYAPGFCEPESDTYPCPYNPILVNDNYYEETGHDAVYTVDLDIENSIISYRLVDIRDGWFDDGGYIDGTFSVQELPLAPELVAHFGMNEIILNKGVYEMISDDETGDYLVNIDVTIN